MIRDYFLDRKQEILDNPSVINLSFDSTATDEHRGFWKAKITFRDGSSLHLFEFVLIGDDEAKVDKYRYHYQNKENELVFRFDDAAHHKDVETFPEHKHKGDEVVDAERPEISKVFDLVTEHTSE